MPAHCCYPLNASTETDRIKHVFQIFLPKYLCLRVRLKFIIGNAQRPIFPIVSVEKYNHMREYSATIERLNTVLIFQHQNVIGCGLWTVNRLILHGCRLCRMQRGTFAVCSLGNKITRPFQCECAFQPQTIAFMNLSSSD